jgi:hypothetical protein
VYSLSCTLTEVGVEVGSGRSRGLARTAFNSYMRVSCVQEEMLHRCLESGLEATRLGLGWRWDRRAGCSRPTAGSRQRLGHEAVKITKGRAAGRQPG